VSTSSTSDLVERVKAKIGWEGPESEAPVEAGHVRRFTQAIGDPNPRWGEEVPPTFLVAFGSETPRLPEALEYGKGWLNGGNRFQYLGPVKIGDTIRVKSRLVDAYEKQGGSGNLLFLVFEAEYRNQHDRVVAIARNTAIRR
jgi:hypothetical protein